MRPLAILSFFLTSLLTLLQLPLTLADPYLFAVNCYDDRTKRPSSQLWYYSEFKGYPSKAPYNYDPDAGGAITVLDGAYYTWETPSGTPFRLSQRFNEQLVFKVTNTPFAPEQEGWPAGTSFNSKGESVMNWFGAGRNSLVMLRLVAFAVLSQTTYFQRKAPGHGK
ncbi:hypothetical protein HDV05_006232 [Chytridiales sp. JEL 0842]|nr:hypothetical protein HDV05_006232 [Chytridiales sp. JEL 0842]